MIVCIMVSEKIVAELWRRQQNIAFAADNGVLIHVIFPGRPSYGGGCDFTDSVFLSDGVTVRGKVEVHSRLQDWYTHGHDNDPRYNEVVLHVVMQFGNSPARLFNGTIVPTICLESVVPSALSPLPVCDYASGYRLQDLVALLENEGYIRFLERASSVQEACTTGDVDRVLLRNVASALGYARNVRQFQRLVDALPPDIAHLSLSELMAVMFGIAGLLPSQRHRCCGDRYSSDMEVIWRSNGYPSVLDAADWCFSGVRPDNYPTRRIAALAHLLKRFGNRGMMEETCRLIDTASLSNGHHCELQFIVDGDEYWASHIDFGINKSLRSSLLGGQRVRDMLVTVLLPCVYALSRRLSEKALRLYMSYPQHGDNEITRYMQQQFSIQGRLTACRQQGLIRLFKTYCRFRECLRCPVAISSG